MYAYDVTPRLTLIELTLMIPVTFRVLVHSELSSLPLTFTQIIGATVTRWGSPWLVLADSTMECFHFNANTDTLWTGSFQK